MFLKEVAKDLLNKYGVDMTDVAVVFPNKRAALFLNNELAQLANKPMWSPSIKIWPMQVCCSLIYQTFVN